MKNKYCEVADGLCPNGIENFTEDDRIFMAYSSHIEEISKMLEDSSGVLSKETGRRWITWNKDMEIENSMIYCEICENICRAKAVLIELSDLNFNVLFEYGYSLGIDKKIHPTVNSDFDFDDIDRFIKPLLGIGIGKYEKGRFTSKMTRKRFWEKDKVNHLFNFSEDDVLTDCTEIDANSILYIKNFDKQDVTERIETEISNIQTNIIIDDPQEDTNNLVWYCKQIKKSYAVIIDLGLANANENLHHFLKCAFIAGLSVATGRRTLILSSIHRKKPSDIISIIKQYANAKEAKRIVSNFLGQHSNSIAIINSYNLTIHHSKKSIFDNVDLGEHVAENDLSLLKSSFIETPEYGELSKLGYKMVIGRKGTGKSAAFQIFKRKKTSSVINISKLFNQYNLDDIYDLTISFTSDNDKNKVVQAFWKFVLYVIIAKETYAYIIEQDNLNEENDLKFMEGYDSLSFINKDKSITENLVDIINKIMDDGKDDVKALQNEFYSNDIVRVINLVGNYYKKSGKTFYLNIDGLDSNLSLRNNSKIVSLILFNLHEICANLFKLELYEYSINLFIRSDIYDTFKEKITEKDKVKKVFYKWDIESLMRMINKRFQENGIENITNILTDDFNIRSLLQKLEKYLYVRPRDYIFFFNNMISIARSQKLDQINNRVFNEALDYYALHIFESIEAELLSLEFQINFGQFLNGVKHLINESQKIPTDYFNKLLNDLNISTENQKILVAFLLNIQFMYFVENNQNVDWSTLVDPDSKLQFILTDSKERKYFSFHPTIDLLLTKHF